MYSQTRHISRIAASIVAFFVGVLVLGVAQAFAMPPAPPVTPANPAGTPNPGAFPAAPATPANPGAGQQGVAGQFQPLVNNLPGVTDASNLPDLLNGLFTITIGIAAILAVLMIGIGGFQYMGTDSFSSKESAKKRITSALIGLGIILGSVLILSTINPNIVDLDPFQGVAPISSTQFQAQQPNANPGGTAGGATQAQPIVNTSPCDDFIATIPDCTCPPDVGGVPLSSQTVTPNNGPGPNQLRCVYQP